MEAIQNAAYVSIGRASGFAGLGIFTMMLGLSFDPALAARTGGLICLCFSGVMYFCGWRAPHKPYKRTEAWLILGKENRPPAAVAQKLMGNALREACYYFGRHGAMIAVFLLIASAAIRFI